MVPTVRSGEPAIRTLVERGRRTRSHGLAALLLFDLAVLIGVWIVHQTEYVIEYGNRFSAVMAGTPHHLYMQPAALVLAVAALTAISVCVATCVCQTRRAREMSRHLPPRIARSLHRFAEPLPMQRLGRTTATLFAAQSLVYAVQENLESWQVTGAFPGTSVLFGSPHLTVLPLSALVASILAVILTAGTARARLTRQTAHIARAFALLFAPAAGAQRPPAPNYDYVPSFQPTAGGRGLRAPPLSV